IELMRELTGRTLSSEHAANLRRRFLDGRQVDRPWAYIATSIRAAPVALLPAPTLRLVRDRCDNPNHAEPLGADGTCVGCASDRKARTDVDDARPVLARPAARPRMPRGPAVPPAQNETEA